MRFFFYCRPSGLFLTFYLGLHGFFCGIFAEIRFEHAAKLAYGLHTVSVCMM